MQVFEEELSENLTLAPRLPKASPIGAKMATVRLWPQHLCANQGAR